MGQLLQFVASYGVYFVIAFLTTNILLVNAPYVLLAMVLFFLAKDIVIDLLKLVRRPWFLGHPYFEHNPFNIAIIYFIYAGGYTTIGFYQNLFLLALLDLIIDGYQDLTLLHRGIRGVPVRGHSIGYVPSESAIKRTPKAKKRHSRR